MTTMPRAATAAILSLLIHVSLWESENIIAMSRPLTKKQITEAQSRSKGDYKELENIKERYSEYVGGN